MFRLNQSALRVSLRVFNVKHLIADIFGVEWGFFQKRNCPLCVCAVMRGLVRLSQSLNSFIIERTEPKQSLMFLIKSSANSAASNGFNNTAQFFCLCFFFFYVLIWKCELVLFKISALNFQARRQREGDKHFILGALLISSKALDWALLSTLPHHTHIITQQLILFPKSQHLELHRENPIGAAHFSICYSV